MLAQPIVIQTHQIQFKLYQLSKQMQKTFANYLNQCPTYRRLLPIQEKLTYLKGQAPYARCKEASIRAQEMYQEWKGTPGLCQSCDDNIKFINNIIAVSMIGLKNSSIAKQRQDIIKVAALTEDLLSQVEKKCVSYSYSEPKPLLEKKTKGVRKMVEENIQGMQAHNFVEGTLKSKNQREKEVNKKESCVKQEAGIKKEHLTKQEEGIKIEPAPKQQVLLQDQSQEVQEKMEEQI